MNEKDILSKFTKKDFCCNIYLRGANLNQRTETGMTPIMAAAINGDWDAVEFLMDRKAELDNKDLKDQSIIHLAAQYDQHELIENLLDHKFPKSEWRQVSAKKIYQISQDCLKKKKERPRMDLVCERLFSLYQ